MKTRTIIGILLIVAPTLHIIASNFFGGVDIKN